MIPADSSRNRPNSHCKILPDSGCYQLIILLAESKSAKIGALGELNFKKGYYIYTGRAKRNLIKRVERHQAKEKKLRWHIDYLLQYSRIMQIIYYAKRLDECIINKNMAKLTNGDFIARFGSSDCKCESHLIWTKKAPCYDIEALS